jgi:hypothetical protein
MRGITASFVIVLTIAAQPARALNESLFFRLTSSGEVEAVVAGDNAGGCAARFLPPTSIAIIGNVVTIVSPDLPLNPCVPPGPPYPRFEVVANLGTLTAPLYIVTWSQGPSVLTAALSPAALAPQSVPTLGAGSLLATALLLAFLGMRRNRLNYKRANKRNKS